MHAHVRTFIRMHDKCEQKEKNCLVTATLGLLHSYIGLRLYIIFIYYIAMQRIAFRPF